MTVSLPSASVSAERPALASDPEDDRIVPVAPQRHTPRRRPFRRVALFITEISRPRFRRCPWVDDSERQEQRAESSGARARDPHLVGLQPARAGLIDHGLRRRDREATCAAEDDSAEYVLEHRHRRVDVTPRLFDAVHGRDTSFDAIQLIGRRDHDPVSLAVATNDDLSCFGASRTSPPVWGVSIVRFVVVIGAHAVKHGTREQQSLRIASTLTDRL